MPLDEQLPNVVTPVPVAKKTKQKKARTRRREKCQYVDCGKPLPEKRNRNKKYCGDACRKAQARLRRS